MNPEKVDRKNIRALTDLPNIGPAMAWDLNLIGIKHPSQLKGQSAYDMYHRLCELTGRTHDPCVIDVFLSITYFANGKEPKPWWAFTAERKKYLSEKLAT